MLAAVAEPVGPVSLGSTTVGADEDVAIVALKSGGGAFAGCGEIGLAGAAIVALGSKGLSVNSPPSIVQNF